MDGVLRSSCCYVSMLQRRSALPWLRFDTLAAQHRHRNLFLVMTLDMGAGFRKKSCQVQEEAYRV